MLSIALPLYPLQEALNHAVPSNLPTPYLLLGQSATLTPLGPFDPLLLQPQSMYVMSDTLSTFSLSLELAAPIFR